MDTLPNWNIYKPVVLDRFGIIKTLNCDENTLSESLKIYITDTLNGRSSLVNKNELMNGIYNFIKQNGKTNINDTFICKMINELITERLKKIEPKNLLQIVKEWEIFNNCLQNVNSIFKYLNFNSSDHSYKFTELIGHNLFITLVLNNYKLVDDIVDVIMNKKINQLESIKTISYIFKGDKDLEKSIIEKIINNIKEDYGNDYDQSINTLKNKLLKTKTILESSEMTFYWELKCRIRISLFENICTDLIKLFRNFPDKISKIIETHKETIKLIYMYNIDEKYNQYRSSDSMQIIDALMIYINNMFKEISYVDSDLTNDVLFHAIHNTIKKIDTLLNLIPKNAKLMEHAKQSYNNYMNDVNLIKYICYGIKYYIIKNEDNLVTIDTMLELCKYIKEPNDEIFVNTYNKYLGERLLNENIKINIHNEKLLIDKIAYILGEKKMGISRRMIAEYETNTMMNNQLINIPIHAMTRKYNKLTFNKKLVDYNVLSARIWKLLETNDYEAILPLEVEFYITIFNSYYRQKTIKNGERNIKWLLDKCISIITININNKDIIVECNLLQLCILYLFNGYTILDEEYLKMSSGMKDSVFDFVIKTLLNSELLLKCENAYKLNDAFARDRISILNIVDKTEVKVEERVLDDTDMQNITMTKIMNLLKKENKIKKDDLYKYVQENTKKWGSINENVINKTLNDLKKRDYIKEEDGFIEYMP